MLADDVPGGFLRAAGFRVLGARAVRLDIVERLSVDCRARAQDGIFAADATLANLLGCSAADLQKVLIVLGYRAAPARGSVACFRLQSAKSSRARGPRLAARAAIHSPFSKLKDLVLP